MRLICWKMVKRLSKLVKMKLEIMIEIKQVFDPNGILNPGKMFI
jgi:FAD/FMN-containing dehydrogenase